MIRFSDIHDNPVLSTASATTVGRIGRPVVDAVERRVVAFGVKKSKGPGDVLPWGSITGIGPYAVTVAAEDLIVDPPKELEGRLTADVDLDLIGHRVLTDHGRDLGKLRDIEFDGTDGRVVQLMLKDAFVEGDRLLGIGPYAVMVKE